MKAEYEIEEYRSLLESKNKNEAQKHQTMIFCFTAFGIINGFSRWIQPNYIIPLAILAVLWVCIIIYRNYHFESKIASTLIIFKYEKKIKGLNIYKQHYKFDKYLNENYFNSKCKIFRIIDTLFSESFIILTLVSILCYYIFAKEYFLSLFKSFSYIKLFYIFITITGYVFVLINIYRVKKRGLNYFFKRYKEFRNKSVAPG